MQLAQNSGSLYVLILDHKIKQGRLFLISFILINELFFLAGSLLRTATLEFLLLFLLTNSHRFLRELSNAIIRNMLVIAALVLNFAPL